MQRFPCSTAVAQLEQWQLRQTSKQWRPCRMQGIYNQIRCSTDIAIWRRVKTKERKDKRISLPLNYHQIRDGNQPPRLKTRSWTLLSNPLSRSPADDLVFLERHFPYQRALLYPWEIPLVVLLVTPSRLELLDDGNPFIPRLFPRIFGDLTLARNLDILVAVVDKIPCPIMSRDVLERMSSDTDGFEGVSVMVGLQQEIAPDLWAPRNLKRTTTQQPGALSFVFNSRASTVPADGYRNSYDLTLPVANTLFHNAQISTLYAERWVTSSADANGIVRLKRALLPQQTLYIDGSLSGDGSYNRLRLSLRLIPIVPPRTIAAAMGNIIRQVYKGLGSNPEATVPASKELEEAIISRKIDSSLGHSIWALVTPRDCEVQEPSVWPSVRRSIKSGSRLHKVLSGGGAWSIKGSLLALDPDCDYNYPDHDMGTSSGDRTKDLARAQFCRDIVNPGDRVSFFTSTSTPNQPHVSLKTQENQDSWIVRGSAEVFLGTLPNSNSALIKSSTPFDHLFIGPHFGMLSERGMSVKIHSHAPSDLWRYGAKKLRLVTQSKLDAPCTAFSARRSSDGPEYCRVEQLHLRNGIVEPSPYIRDESNTKDDESALAIARMSDLAQSLGLQKTKIHKTRSNVFIRFRKFRPEKNPEQEDFEDLFI